MGDYSQAAEFYDLLYAPIKDYGAESAIVAQLIRAVAPAARSVLDVACGTGMHAQALTGLGFDVDGVDLEPAFIAIASTRSPMGSFWVGDMTSFRAPRRYDAIVCLFSAIAYAHTPALLRQTLTSMAAHLEPGGVVVIDPWFEPGQLTDGWISTITGAADGVEVCRMSRTVIDGPVSRLELEYLVGTARGIERRTECHALGLFTRDQMESAFHEAGLSVEWTDAALRRRGAYVGQKANRATT